MASTAVAMMTIQSQVAADIGKRAAEVLERQGLTVDEAVNQMLTRTAESGALPFPMEAEYKFLAPGDDAAYDAWVSKKIQQSVEDPRPAVTHEEVRRRMKTRRAAALARIA